MSTLLPVELGVLGPLQVRRHGTPVLTESEGLAGYLPSLWHLMPDLSIYIEAADLDAALARFEELTTKEQRK